jgi:hypothetical protein
MTMRSRRERTPEDADFERRVLSAYGPLCEHFFYTTLVGVTLSNWDRTSRQSAIQILTEAQPLYLQPESREAGSILMVNANGRGVGQLESHVGENLSKSLQDGRQWHAHVRKIRPTADAEGSESWDVVILLLLMVTPGRYAELVQERRLMTIGETAFPVPMTTAAQDRNSNLKWTLLAMFLLGIAVTMM